MSVTRTLESDRDVDDLVKLIRTRKFPINVRVESGKPRSIEQNRLQRMWIAEVALQLGDRTPEEVRGEMKLRFGVPILRQDNDTFREKYDRLIKGMPYEAKLELMMEPLDFPVTRLMTTKQKTEYLDAIHRFYSEQGVRLTDPEGRYPT